MRNLSAKLNDTLCYLFGHTGNFTESGYHVCSRCGLHEYWSSRRVDPDAPVDYDRAGIVYRYAVWPVEAWVRGWGTRLTRKPVQDDDIPF